MKNEILIRNLRTVGYACFVKYFHLFYNKNIPNYEIEETIKKENNYTEKSCRSRTGHARMIINNGEEKEALDIIINAKKIDMDIKKLAEELLKQIT